jgi:hypothetical protein
VPGSETIAATTRASGWPSPMRTRAQRTIDGLSRLLVRAYLKAEDLSPTTTSLGTRSRTRWLVLAAVACGSGDARKIAEGPCTLRWPSL